MDSITQCNFSCIVVCAESVQQAFFQSLNSAEANIECYQRLLRGSGGSRLARNTITSEFIKSRLDSAAEPQIFLQIDNRGGSL